MIWSKVRQLISALIFFIFGKVLGKILELNSKYCDVWLQPDFNEVEIEWVWYKLYAQLIELQWSFIRCYSECETFSR